MLPRWPPRKTRPSEDSLRDAFDASVRDITPEPNRASVRILHLAAPLDCEITSRCATILSPLELDRAKRFLADDDAARFVQRRAFRRYCAAVALDATIPLSQMVFDETEKGRPFLSDRPGLSFSFSSCRTGFLGAWSSSLQLGVDIEETNREVAAIELANQYFCASEAEAVQKAGVSDRRRIFLRLWTLKEAALKSVGEGLPFGLDAFRFALTPHPRVVQAPTGYGAPARFTSYPLEADGGTASLVLRSPSS
jgi:phosphopantetheinyl transferase